MRDKKVYVLGTGASVMGGLPVMDDFFHYVLLRICEVDKEDVNGEIKEFQFGDFENVLLMVVSLAKLLGYQEIDINELLYDTSDQKGEILKCLRQKIDRQKKDNEQRWGNFGKKFNEFIEILDGILKPGNHYEEFISSDKRTKDVVKKEIKKLEDIKFKQEKIKKVLNMETVFTFIDNISKKNPKGYTFAFQKERKPNTSNEKLRRQLLYVIFRTFHLCWTNKLLYEKASKIDLKIWEGRKKLYKRFLQRIRKDKPTIITFNYDLIIDHMLLAIGVLPDYGFNIIEENVGIINENLLSKELYHHSRDEVRLLKMHGSFEFFEIQNCDKYFLKFDIHDNWSSGVKNDYAISGEKCPTNNKIDMDFLIIPPMEEKKEPEQRILKTIWKRAFAELREATELIFIGYSFPYTDKNIYNLFKEYLSDNYLLHRVIVINTDKEVERKYKEMLGKNHEDKIEYHSEPFESIVKVKNCLDSIF